MTEVALICVRRSMVRYEQDRASPERQLANCVRVWRGGEVSLASRLGSRNPASSLRVSQVTTRLPVWGASTAVALERILCLS
jgi:hypothetical protein